MTDDNTLTPYYRALFIELFVILAFNVELIE
jgi:hypothetical protein